MISWYNHWAFVIRSENNGFISIAPTYSAALNNTEEKCTDEKRYYIVTTPAQKRLQSMMK